MFTLILFVISLVGSLISILVYKSSNLGKIKILLLWLLVCSVGLGGIWAFIGHAFFPGDVAKSIGWATSPFQWEIAMANLAFGIAGVFAFFYRGRFHLAVGITVNVYLLGCAAGHIKDMISSGNFSINNAGPILWIGDLIMPLTILTLLVILEILQQKERN